MHNALPKELDFLNQYRVNRKALEHATWRISDFSAAVWECVFGTARLTIDFRKVIDDGRLLTDPKHLALLNDLKRFLCLQTHPLITGSAVLAPRAARFRIAIALHTLDYFLLRCERIGLAYNGFRLVTDSDVMEFIDVLTSNRAVKTSIYEPTRRMLSFLANVEVSEDDIAKTRASYPDLFKLDDGVNFILPRAQLLTARAWLLLNGCYSSDNPGNVTEFRYRVTRRRLLAIVIGSKVLDDLKFDGLELPGLDVAPSRWFAQELPAVPVNNLDEDERASIEHASRYVAVLKSMRMASQHGMALIPNFALAAVNDAGLLLKERTKERVRFTTLPFALANNLLGKSIQFFLEYGEHLVDYYLALARDRKDIHLLSVEVPSKLRALGVITWRSNAETAEEFFQQLRRGESLFNMLEVLLGAVAVMVNMLMARRASELEDLSSASIVLEQGAYFLAFDLRKANVLEHRQRLLRPLPTIAAEALTLLARMSRTLRELGYKTHDRLFAVPCSAWQISPPCFGTTQPDLRRCFDRFCDFYQTGQDDLGRRYYVRAHQQRRNFAMMFFWNGSFGGIEVLQYFLGQQKPSDTYRYVTEAVSGKVLRRVKADVAKDLLKANHPATEELAQLLCERYGLTLNDLYILPESDVLDYVEDLLASGEAQIEPEFFEGPTGEEYRILYRVAKLSES